MSDMTNHEYWTEQAIVGITMMLRAGKRPQEIKRTLCSISDDIDELIATAEERVNARASQSTT